MTTIKLHKLCNPFIRLMPWTSWVICVALILIGVSWLNQSGPSTDIFMKELLAGQVMYVYAKLFGLWGLFLLGCQAIYGLSPISLRKKLLFTSKRSTHQTIGLITAALLLSHVTALIWSVAMRMGQTPWRFLGFNFTQDYYHTAMSIGAVSLWILTFALIVPLMLCAKCKRMIHRLGVIVFITGWVHCMLIGTETRMSTVFIILTTQGVWISLLILFQAWKRLSRPL